MSIPQGLSPIQTGATLAAAREYLRAGISVIPIRTDASKAPAARWKPYQGELATDDELCEWYDRPRPYGIATVCGAVSGGLELLDLDHLAERTYPAWTALVEAERPGLVARLNLVETPGKGGPGYHVRYRVAGVDVPGNTLLATARNPDFDPAKPAGKDNERTLTLIETRGEGGYALAPGSPIECHPRRLPYRHIGGPPLSRLPTIEADERECLIRCARAIGEAGETREEESSASSATAGCGPRPGDDYDRRGPDWAAILEPHGWRCVRQDGAIRYWRRPGKDGPGWSATTGHCTSGGAELLRVFSSLAEPLRDGGSYGRFRALALLEHAGDLAAAARELRRQGYGGDFRAPAPNCPPSTTLPTVVIGTDEHRVVAEVTRALAADDGLFQRDGVVVRVVETGEPEPADAVRSSGLRVRHPEGAHGLRPASPAYIRLRTTATVRLIKTVETEDGPTERDCHPPAWLAPAIVEVPGPIRPVRGVLLGPSVDASGRLIAAAGYDAPTRLYLTRPVPDLAIPDRPSREDARAAALLLCDLVGQFPWQGRPDLSRWLSLLLTACGRHLIGTVPLGLITATTAGSGKTLLACVISAIAHGLRQPITMSWPEGSELQCRGDEVRKRLASLLHESATLVLIDNLPRGEAFGGPEIDAFLTADAYYDRQLGKNDGSRVGGPNRCLLLGTGNAVRPDGDTADRTLVVSLVPDHPNPRARPADEFVHPALIDHILRERRRYLGAALTLWRAWILADCPRPAGPSWGSFAGWVDTVASAVRWLDLAELPDPIGDRVRIASEMDGEAQALCALVGLWPAVLGTQLLTAGEIIRRLDGETPTADQQAVREALAALGAGWRWPPTGIRLGKTLTSYLMRVVDVGGDTARLISDPDSHRKVHRYACERMPAGNAGSAGSLTPLPRARGDESADVHVF